MWGEGVKRKSDVTHPRIQSNQFSFLQFSIFKSPQNFLKINPFWRSKFFKSFLTSHSLADRIAFERSVITFYHCCIHFLVTNHRFPLGISSNTGSFYLLFFTEKFVTFCRVTWGGGRSREKMTKCDMGGGGLKNGPFWGDILFAWPLTPHIS